MDNAHACGSVSRVNKAMSGFFMSCPRLSFGLYVYQNMGIGTGQNG